MTDMRPTKKQRELLSFIDGFIKGNGYGPSYREVMRALEYKSVSTVATHIDGLIARGFLRKETHSARSLEVVGMEIAATPVDVRKQWIQAVFTQKLDELQAIEGDESLKQQQVLRDAALLLDVTLDPPVK